MGEQFIRRHTQQFEHLQDAAFEEELKRRHLFSERPETFTMEYGCRPTASVGPIVGEPVMVRKTATGEIEVIWRNSVIGRIEGADAQQIRSAMLSDGRSCDWMAARVREQSPISGYLKVRCDEGTS